MDGRRPILVRGNIDQIMLFLQVPFSGSVTMESNYQQSNTNVQYKGNHKSSHYSPFKFRMSNLRSRLFHNISFRCILESIKHESFNDYCRSSHISKLTIHTLSDNWFYNKLRVTYQKWLEFITWKSRKFVK